MSGSFGDDDLDAPLELEPERKALNQKLPEPEFDREWATRRAEPRRPRHTVRAEDLSEPDEPEATLELDLDRAPPRLGGPSVPPPAAAVELAPPPRSLPAPAEQVFHCPKCGTEQRRGEVCVRCGVVFAKLSRIPSATSGSGPSAAAAGVKIVKGEPSAGAKPAAPEEFWPSIGRAFLVPFTGQGVLWLPLLVLILAAGVFLGGRIGFLMKLGFVGLLANYFANSAGNGISGEARAPNLRKPNDVMSEFVWPGLALVGLAVVLWGPPVYFTVVGLVEGVAATLEQAVENMPEEERQSYEPWNPDEVFRNQAGEFVQVEEEDAPQLLKRHDGRWVEVDPEEGYVMVMPVAWEPDQAPPAGAAAEESGGLEVMTLSSALAKINFPTSKLLLVLGLIFFGFYYWPMALTVGALSDNLFNVFNPVAVLTPAIKAGVEYLAVVAAGGLILAAAFLIATQIPLLLTPLLFLGGLGYLAGVQGYLMGRLVASKRSAFPDLKI